MAAFDHADGLNGDRAFRLMSNTFITMFWSNTLLRETLDWLEQQGYETVEVDAANLSETAALLDGLAGALDFPDYFGPNVDAFNDCMSDVA